MVVLIYLWLNLQGSKFIMVVTVVYEFILLKMFVISWMVRKITVNTCSLYTFHFEPL